MRRVVSKLVCLGSLLFRVFRDSIPINREPIVSTVLFHFVSCFFRIISAISEQELLAFWLVTPFSKIFQLIILGNCDLVCPCLVILHKVSLFPFLVFYFLFLIDCNACLWSRVYGVCGDVWEFG